MISIARSTNTLPAAISVVVGRRLESGSPARWGWVGPCSRAPLELGAKLAEHPWTIVPDGSLQRRAAQVAAERAPQAARSRSR